MEIHLSYLDGKWETTSEWNLIMDAADEKKLAQLIQGTVSRFRDRQLKESPEKSKALSEVIQAINPPDLTPEPKKPPEEPVKADPPKIKEEVILKRSAMTFEGQKYKGLLCIYCPECKNEFWLWANTPIDEITCNCGHRIKLEGLVHGQTHCSVCGKKSRWYTNLETGAMKHTCKCGNEVTCRWNAKANQYEGEK